MRRVHVPLAVLLLAGCAAGGDGGEDDPGEIPAPPASGAGTPSSPAQGAAGCEEVPTELLQTIESGGENATGFTVTAGAAYRSGSVWLVAAEFTATGVDAQSGVWAVEELSADADVVAVDPVAQQFTVWPDAAADADGVGAEAGADGVGADVSAEDPAVQAALGCLG